MDTLDSREDAPRVLVHLPNTLRKITGIPSPITVSGHTVRGLVDALDREYPGFRFHLCYETGELRPYINIFLNRENIRYLRGLDTPLPHDATLHIFPSVAGGSPDLKTVCTDMLQEVSR